MNGRVASENSLRSNGSRNGRGDASQRSGYSGRSSANASSHSFASVAERNRLVMESLRGVGDMSRYADNNIVNLFADVRGGVRSPDRRLHLAKVISTYLACNNSDMPWDIYDQLLRMVVSTPLIRGSGLLKTRLHPKAVLRGDVRRFRRLRDGFEDAMDADDGLWRAAMSQICRMTGAVFYYSVAKTMTLLHLAQREEEITTTFETDRLQKCLCDFKERRNRAVAAQGRDSNTLNDWVGEQEGAVMMVDKRAIIVALTPGLAEMFGYEPDQLLGKEVHQLTPVWLRATHQEKVNLWFSNPMTLIGRLVEAAHRDGTKMQIELNLDHVDAKVEHFVIARIFDASKRARVLDELEVSLAEIRARMLAEQAPILPSVLRDAAPARLLLVDEQSHISYCSQSAGDAFGRTPAFIQGQLLDVLVPSHVRGRHQMLVRQFFKRDSYLRINSYITEEKVPVTLHAKRIRTAEGPRCLAMIELRSEESDYDRVSHLITENLVKAEERVQERMQTEALALLKRRLLDPEEDVSLVVVSKLGCIVASTEDTLGYSSEDLLYQPVDILTPDHIRSTHWLRVQSFFTNPNQLGGTGRLVGAKRKDGSMTRCLLRLEQIMLPSGMHVMATLRDMHTALTNLAAVRQTLLDQAEMRLRTEDLDVERLLEQTQPHAVLICQQDGTMMVANEALQGLSGWTQADMLGQNVSMLTPHHVRADHDKKLDMYFIDPKARTLDKTRGKQPVHIARKDGEYVQVSITLDICRTRWGKCAAAVVMDHTQLQERRDAVEEEKYVEEEERQLNGKIMKDITKSVGWWAVVDS